MRKKLKQLMGILLSLVMVLGLMPGMSLTAYAGTEKYTALKNNNTVVTFNGYNWYIIEDNSTSDTEGTVTLLAADDKFGTSKFSNSYSNVYSNSKIKTDLDQLTAEGGAFADVADAIQTVKVKGSDSDTEVDAKLYLLDTATAQNLSSTILGYTFPNADRGAWWLRSPGDYDEYAACVFGEYGFVFFDGYNV